MRKQLTLFLLLLVGIGLLLARRWWLPPFLAQIPQIEARAELIQAIEALVSLLVLVANLVLGYLLWLARQEEQKPEELLPLTATSADRIREGLGQWGGRVNWIDRGATRPAELRRHTRLALIGPSRMGKTREAAELIRRAVDDDLIPDERAFEPSRYFRFIGAEGLASAIQRQIDPQQPLLFFIDDLPYHFYGDGLQQLDAALTGLSRCKELYVIATLRTDQTTDEHRSWLHSHGFHVAGLTALTPEQSGRQVDGAAGLFGLRVSDEARQVFVERSRGVPELALAGLRHLHAEKATDVDREDALRVMQESVGEAWAEARRKIEEKHPIGRHLLDALGVFYAARVRAYEPLVLHYAARQAGAARFSEIWQLFTVQRHLRAALSHLALFDIRIQEGIVRFPNEVANDAPDVGEARARLGVFLAEYRRLFHNRWLRRFHRQQDAQRWAVFDLGVGYEKRKEIDSAIQYYSLGLRISPHEHLYHLRVHAQLEKGNSDAAFTDFAAAIRSSPEDAVHYYCRGQVREDQGDLTGALADYDRAIEFASDTNVKAQTHHRRARIHQDQSNTNAALSDFNAAILLEPETARHYYCRGNLYRQQGDLTGALADYDLAIQLNPEDGNAYYNRGLTRSAEGDLTGALADFDRAIEINPENAEVYYNWGLARGNLGDLAGALADFDRAIEINPENAEVYYNRGLARGILGDLTLALADFDRAIELNPENAEVYYNRGLAHRDRGDLTGALADFDRTIEFNPESAEAYYNRGNVHRDLGDLTGALTDFDRAIEFNPVSAEAYYNRGNVHRDLGDLTGALTDFDRAIELNPEGTEAYNNRGVTRRDRGDLIGAIADYDWAIQLFPDGPDRTKAYNNRGNARRDQGDLTGALADYDRVIEFTSDTNMKAQIYHSRAHIHEEQRDTNAALSDFNTAIRLEPESANHYYCRGNLYRQQGDLTGAVADYDLAIQLNPQYVTAYYNRGNARSDLGEYQAAIADFDQAIQLDPKYVYAYYNRGNARSDLGEFQAAIADFDQAIQIDPEYAYAYISRGNARRDLGDHLAAIADYDRAIQFFPDREGKAAAYGNRGNVRCDLGEQQAAIADFDQAIQLFLDGADKARAYRRKAMALRQLERYDEAVAVYRQTVAIEPDSLIAWMGLAAVAQPRGDEEEWREAVEKARPLLDESDFYSAACFYSIAGEVERALELLAQAIAERPGRSAWAKEDPDLAWIRDDPRFRLMVED